MSEPGTQPMAVQHIAVQHSAADARPIAGQDVAADPPPAAVKPTALDFLLVGWLTLLTMVTTGFVVFFLPWYAGTVPLPLSALVGAAVVFLGVRICYELTRSMVAAFAPALGWLAVSVVLSTWSSFSYSLVIGDWRSQLMLGLGALGAAVALGSAWGTHAVRRNVPVVTRSGDGLAH